MKKLTPIEVWNIQQGHAVGRHWSNIRIETEVKERVFAAARSKGMSPADFLREHFRDLPQVRKVDLVGQGVLPL